MTEELWDRLEAFVCGRISLGALRDWLVPRWPQEQIECDIYCQIEMALVHIEDGIESEDDIRGQLSVYLIERATTGSNRTIRVRWALEV